jgi:lysophospholipase L1-like esterase
MERVRKAEMTFMPWSYGCGYPIFVAGELANRDPEKYHVYNRGIAGNRIVDLYARIKSDVWNLQPDILTILIGVNDIWHEIMSSNGVEIERWDKIYRMLIEDTLKVLPKTKIILLEPFVLHGTATNEEYDRFLQIKEYAKVLRKIAEDYNLYFLPLQNDFDQAAKKYKPEDYLYDGVHPMLAGSRLIADKWLELFTKIEKEKKSNQKKEYNQ